MKKLLIIFLFAACGVIIGYLSQPYFSETETESEVSKSLSKIDETTLTDNGYPTLTGSLYGDELANAGDRSLMGAWSYGFYTDEFGDLTDKGYIKLTGYGSFSNSATSWSPLRVEMFMSNGNRTPFFRFHEYNTSNPLRGFRDLHLFKCRIEDSQDHIFPLKLYLRRGRDELTVKFYKDQIKYIDALDELINNEDSAKFSCYEEDQSSEYRFKLDFKYKDNAERKLMDEELIIIWKIEEEKEKRREEYRLKRREEEKKKRREETLK